jgi:hypothetical protein
VSYVVLMLTNVNFLLKFGRRYNFLFFSVAQVSVVIKDKSTIVKKLKKMKSHVLIPYLSQKIYELHYISEGPLFFFSFLVVVVIKVEKKGGKRKITKDEGFYYS